MRKIDLSEYSDEEILNAIIDLPTRKFVPLINGVSLMTDRLKDKGAEVASQQPLDRVDEMLKDVFEDGEKDEQ